MELEISLITSWKDTQVTLGGVGGTGAPSGRSQLVVRIQLSQAGDLIIEVYLEAKTPDSCVTLKVASARLRTVRAKADAVVAVEPVFDYAVPDPARRCRPACAPRS